VWGRGRGALTVGECGAKTGGVLGGVVGVEISLGRRETVSRKSTDFVVVVFLQESANMIAAGPARNKR